MILMILRLIRQSIPKAKLRLRNKLLPTVRRAMKLTNRHQPKAIIRRQPITVPATAVHQATIQAAQATAAVRVRQAIRSL